jgi:hypothetical protein
MTDQADKNSADTDDTMQADEPNEPVTEVADTAAAPGDKSTESEDLAWSLETDDTPTHDHRWRPVISAALVTLLCLIVGVVTWFSITLYHQNDSRPAASAPSSLAAPTPKPAPPPPPPVTVTAAPPPAPAMPVPTTTTQAPTLVLVTPPPPPAFSGRYTVTETWSNGRVVTEAWNVVPCGPKCVNITPEAGGSTVQALLHSGSEKAWAGATDGQLLWTFSTSVADTGCPGSHGGAAFIIDAYTLSGTVTKGWGAACGQPAETDVDKIVLTPAN